MRFGFLFLLSILSFQSLEAETLRERIKSKVRERMNDRLSAEPVPVTQEIPGHIVASGLYTQSLEVKGQKRYYKLYVPKKFDQKKSYALVFALHGGGGDMNIQSNDEYYKQISVADKNDYVVIIPNGYSPFPSGKLATWNAGNCCGNARDLNIDDISFFKAMIEKTKNQIQIDSKKIFTSGMSNGAMMSYRLACEMSDVFSGIASVAGTDNTKTCSPTKPISIFHTHAKDDDHVKYQGGIGAGAVDKQFITEFKSVTETIQKWVQLNQCQPIAKRTSEGKGFSCERYEDCKGGAVVQLCVTETGGHSWPGGKAPRMARKKNIFQGFSATEKNWEFFSGIRN